MNPGQGKRRQEGEKERKKKKGKKKKEEGTASRVNTVVYICIKRITNGILCPGPVLETSEAITPNLTRKLILNLTPKLTQ